MPKSYVLPARQAQLAKVESAAYAKAWSYAEEAAGDGTLAPGGVLAVLKLPDGIEIITVGTKVPDTEAPHGWRRIYWDEGRRGRRWLIAGWY